MSESGESEQFIEKTLHQRVRDLEPDILSKQLREGPFLLDFFVSWTFVDLTNQKDDHGYNPLALAVRIFVMPENSFALARSAEALECIAHLAANSTDEAIKSGMETATDCLYIQSYKITLEGEDAKLIPVDHNKARKAISVIKSISATTNLIM